MNEMIFITPAPPSTQTNPIIEEESLQPEEKLV